MIEALPHRDVLIVVSKTKIKVDAEEFGLEQVIKHDVTPYGEEQASGIDNQPYLTALIGLHNRLINALSDPDIVAFFEKYDQMEETQRGKVYIAGVESGIDRDLRRADEEDPIPVLDPNEKPILLDLNNLPQPAPEGEPHVHRDRAYVGVGDLVQLRKVMSEAGQDEDKHTVLDTKGHIIFARSRGVVFPDESVEMSRNSGWTITAAEFMGKTMYKDDPTFDHHDPQDKRTGGELPRKLQMLEPTILAFQQYLVLYGSTQ